MEEDDLGYFVDASRGIGPPETPDAPSPGRPVPPPLPIVRRRPESNRLGPVALFCGVVAMLLGMTLPWFVLLIVITAGGGLVIGAITLQHSLSTGAPGRWLALGGMLTGAIGAVLMVVALMQAGRDVADTTREFTGLLGSIDAMMVASEISSLDLPGSGEAVIELAETTLSVPLDGCGFHDPVPGLALAGQGRVEEGRPHGVAFSSKSLGTPEDVVVVELGSTPYVLSAEGGLFTLDGDTVVVAGTFRELPGRAELPGRVEATCSR